MQPGRQGWGQPSTHANTKWHYFDRGNSLCGQYETGDFNIRTLSPPLRDQCARCWGRQNGKSSLGSD